MVLIAKLPECENIIAAEKRKVETAGLPHSPDGFAGIEANKKARGISFQPGSVVALSG
jgi:hypothetical protein